MVGVIPEQLAATLWFSHAPFSQAVTTIRHKIQIFTQASSACLSLEILRVQIRIPSSSSLAWQKEGGHRPTWNKQSSKEARTFSSQSCE